MTDYLFDIPPIEPKDPFPDKTCRTCAHRQRWGNEFSTKVTQHCGVQPSRRTPVGYKRIKVTDKACSRYEEDK